MFLAEKVCAVANHQIKLASQIELSLLGLLLVCLTNDLSEKIADAASARAEFIPKCFTNYKVSFMERYDCKMAMSSRMVNCKVASCS